MASRRTASKMIMGTALARTVKPASFIQGNLRSFNFCFSKCAKTSFTAYIDQKIPGNEGGRKCCS